MNKLFTYLILPSLTLISLNLFGQNDHFKCGTTEKLLELYAKDPSLKTDQEALIKNSKKVRKEKGVDQTVYTIPVVFHIIHQYGVENITDAQVYNQMELLNEDYRLKNTDTSLIVPIFKKLKGEAFIEFKLATKDPWGNCTNGIEHIYSHETQQGNDDSKLNGWHRSKYLNVWVVSKMGGGAAGYSMYPSAVTGGNFYADGVIILHDYIGEIGTGQLYNSTALTHEIGHWLGLAHTWGSTNEPGVSCGDPSTDDGDNIDDTPRTAGHLLTCNSNDLNKPNCAKKNIHEFTFDKVSLTSGVYDSTYVPTPAQPAQQWDLGKFHAVGVASNPSDIDRFSFANWALGGAAINNDTTYASMTGAINTAKYYEITLTPKNSITPTLASIDFAFQRNATGPRTYAVRSSIDGFTTNLVPKSTNSNIKIRNNNFFCLKDTSISLIGNVITLDTLVTYKNLTGPVSFRIYAWNAEDALGTFSIDDLKITGNDGVIENTQNYMEYSYCSKMFTIDQVAEMRYNLLSSVAERNNLITSENHTFTGIDVLSPVVCAPVADFSVSAKSVCQGGNLTFSDASWQAPVTSRTWTFEGGTPSTSTSATQVVTYDSPGYKKVTLSVTSAGGTDEKVEEKYIFVSDPWGDFTGPMSNDLENDHSFWFLVENPENNEAKFHLSYGTGYDKTTCYKLNNYFNADGAQAYSPEWFYKGRLGGNKDALITPSYDLSHTSNVNLTFNYSYATNGSVLPGSGVTNADITEELLVYASKDCGETWQLKLTIKAAELLTGGFTSGIDFVPSNNNQWKSATISYPASSTDKKTRFKFVFNASDASNNLYLDNINVDGYLGLIPNEINDLDLSIFPNPLSSQQSINVSYYAGENSVELILRDAQGKVVHAEVIDKTNTKVNHTLELNKALSSSCYFLEVKSGDYSTVKKVVVL